MNPPDDSLRDWDWYVLATADDPPSSDEERMALEAGETPRSDNYETGDQDHELPRVRE